MIIKVILCYIMFLSSLSGDAFATGDLPLVQQKDMIYQGAFRVPKGNLGGASTTSNSLAYSGSAGRSSALTYNSLRNSLFLIGHSDSEQILTEISIPAEVNSPNLAELNTATVVQSPTAICNGNWANLTENGSAITNGGVSGGFLLFNGRLIGTSYAYYDGAGQATRSHFTASPNWLADGSTKYAGMYKVGTSGGGLVGGYMATIPNEWRGALGGPALTGLAGVAVISRSSYGPCAFVFNPDDVSIQDPAPATMLIGYPVTHQDLNCYCDAPSLYYNRSTTIRGLIFPNGSSSILFFGRHGLGASGQGDSCYGIGTYDISLNSTLVSSQSQEKYCYDPSDLSKGTHAYPYVYRVWAYDANDLTKVRNSTINPSTNQPFQPWELRPYAIWNLELPLYNSLGNGYISGAAYDPSTQKIYILQADADRPAYDYFPIIHVYKLSLHTSSSIIPPPVKLWIDPQNPSK